MKKSYAEEMAWALGKAYAKNNDRNPNRMAQVTAALEYGLAVSIARRGHEAIPPRPNIDMEV